MKAIVQLFLALVLVVGFMPLYPTAASAEAERAAMAEADGTSTAGTDGESATEDSCSTYELVAQAEADGDCAPGQALVVYHASGAAKGSTGALTIQSEDDPLADSGFMAADTWDLSAADDVAEENGAATDGALTVQSEDTGSAIASGSDVRVALVERDGMSVADLVASLEALDFVECAQPNYVITSSDDEAAAESLASAFFSTDTAIDTASVAGAAASAATGASTSATTLSASTSATTLSASSYGPLSLPAGITTDTFSSLQWALSGPDSSIGGSTAGVDVSAAYKAEASGTTDNVVAIIDDSLDYTNPDLAAAAWTNPGNLGIGPAGSHGFNGATGAYDPIPSSEIHGTHCAGIAAATTGNALGIASPSGNGTHTKVMGLRYENDAGYGFYSGITGCYEYLVKARLAGVKIPVVSCSWGSSDGASYIPVLDYLINQAGKAGVLSFFASGNEARDAYNYHDSTAIESPYCIQIASSDETGSLSHFTTYQETGVDIAAPGSAILSTISAATSENFKALLTHMSGDYDAQTNPNGRADKLSYYTDVAELLSEPGAHLKIELTDGASGTPLSAEAQKALTYEAVTSTGSSTVPAGQNVLKLTIDHDALAKLGVKSVPYVSVNWQFANPFFGETDLEASDYHVDVTVGENGYTSGQTAAVFESLLDSESNNIAVDDSNTFTKKDYNRTDGGALKSIAEDDETLQASLSVMISNFDDTPTGTQSCLLTGYGIGRATNPTDDPESAFVPYCYENGTSMAAPLVAGCTAEIAALHPEYSPLQLRGIVCGGTMPLASESDQSKIASGGRFTFAAALDDAEVNANTWSITTSGTSVTVHGYNLDGASLFVDQDTVAITPTAQSESEITFTADPALFDGESHRFDVTDGATGRTYKAAYVMPDGQADTLVRVHYLPDVADAATVALVSTPDRLFLADQYGTFFYSCTDPTDAASAWTKLTTPRIPWTSTGGENRAPMAFAYANGKIYAFSSDNEGTSSEIAAIYCTIYDIAAGAWSACTQIGSVDTEAVAALSACAVDGRVYCSVVGDDQVYSSTSVVLFACSSDGSAFTQSEVTIPDDGNLSATLHVVNGALYGFIEPKQAKDWQEYQASLAYCNLSTSTFVSVGTLDAYGTTDDYFFVRGLLTRVQTAVGNGIVVAGQNTDGCSGCTAGLGDLQLVGTDAGVTGLGSYGLEPAADGFTVGAMAMFKDKLYLEAIDLSVGIKAPALYTLPASGASRLASTDVIETAAVGTPTTGADAGGTATVADWRGEASSALSVRMGDTAIWTATPQTGYHFVGWYDEDGNEVSTAATYAVPVDSAMTLTAQFAADPAPTPSTPTPAPTSASTSTTVIPAETPASGNAATLPYTGDPLAPFAVVPSALASSALAALCLIAAAGTLLLRTRRNDRR